MNQDEKQLLESKSANEHYNGEHYEPEAQAVPGEDMAYWSAERAQAESQVNEIKNSEAFQPQASYPSYQHASAATAAKKSHRSAWIAVAVVCALLSAVASGLIVHHYEQSVARSEHLRESRSRSSLPAPDKQTEDQEKVQSEPAILKKGKTEPEFSLEKAAQREMAGKTTLNIAEIAKHGKPAVVAISTETAVQTPFGSSLMPTAGSGFLITEDGYIVTNNHVIEGAKRIQVRLDDSQVYEAALVGADSFSDLAVLKITAKEGESFPALSLGNSSDLVVGELAVAIGNPTGTLEGTVTAGIISALEREITIEGNEMTLLQTSAAINAGNSGGALFNSFGEVVGINTAKLSGRGSQVYEGLGFAIPIDQAKPIIEDLIRNGYVTDRVYFGISGEDVSANVARYYGIAQEAGFYVRQVAEGGPAEAAGLHEGDFIVKMADSSIGGIADVNNLKKKLKVGDTVKVLFYREGKQQETELTLTRVPAPQP